MNVLLSAWGSTGEQAPGVHLIKLLVKQEFSVDVLASEARADLYQGLGIRFHSLRSIDIQHYPYASLQKEGEVVRHFVDPLCNEQFARASELIAQQSVDLLLSSWITPGVVTAA